MLYTLYIILINLQDHQKCIPLLLLVKIFFMYFLIKSKWKATYSNDALQIK